MIGWLARDGCPIFCLVTVSQSEPGPDMAEEILVKYLLGHCMWTWDNFAAGNLIVDS